MATVAASRPSVECGDSRPKAVLQPARRLPQQPNGGTAQARGRRTWAPKGSRTSRARLVPRPGSDEESALPPMTRTEEMGHRLLASLLAPVLFWSSVGSTAGLTRRTQPFPEQTTAFASANARTP